MLILRTLAWGIAIVYSTVPLYWLIVHRRASGWARSGGKRLFVVGPIWAGMWLAFGALTWPWRLVTLYRATWTWFIGACLIVSGLLIYGRASKGFTMDQALGRAELEPHKHPQQLVTTGIRSHIRHPYYLGHLLELLGWTIGSGLLACYLMTILGVISGFVMIRSEEKELEQRFGDDYRAYQRRSAAMFPRLW